MRRQRRPLTLHTQAATTASVMQALRADPVRNAAGYTLERPGLYIRAKNEQRVFVRLMAQDQSIPAYGWFRVQPDGLARVTVTGTIYESRSQTYWNGLFAFAALMMLTGFVFVTRQSVHEHEFSPGIPICGISGLVFAVISRAGRKMRPTVFSAQAKGIEVCLKERLGYDRTTVG